ncbi:MAG: hypothetical protein WAO90_11705 [Mycobacterium sp.]
MRRSLTAGVAAALTMAVPLAPGAAAADDDDPQPDDLQHNVTYRARVDGLARGALVSYRISDSQVSSVDPTMLPGRTFEATAVLSDPEEAGMRISIQWPYSANLHCEILVDDQLYAQADQFIGPKLTPARDDPDYGAMNCGAPLSNATGLPADVLDPPPPLPGDGGDPPVLDVPALESPALEIPAADLGAPVS